MWAKEYCYGVRFEMMIKNEGGMVMIVDDEAGGVERVYFGWARGKRPRQASTCLFQVTATHDRRGMNVIFDSNPSTEAADHGDY